MKFLSKEELKAFELAEKIIRTDSIPKEICDEFDKIKENTGLPDKICMYDAIITVVQKKAQQQKRSEMDILTDFEKIVDKKSTTGGSDNEGGLELKHKDKPKDNIKQHSTGKSSVKNTTRSATNTSSTTSRNTISTTVSVPISASRLFVPEPVLEPTEEDEEEFE